jgi:arylsulfatase
MKRLNAWRRVAIALGVVALLAMAARDGWALGPEEAPGASEALPLGAPGATRTIDGKQLPAPALKFGGVIKDNAFQSKPFWPPNIVPPKGAPNVLLIMTDDVGFGAPSTFGGVIPTPALDRIAKAGLRYTQFHSTALCSPTRAALLTGRNHHSAGFGVVSEMSTGFPGYDSIIGRDCATIGRMLKENGYATSWFGKDHNVPEFEASQVGPFDRWPIGMGFDYFYGFVGGDTSQWQPNLFRQTTPIYPYVGKPKWNLTTAMADDAIDHIKMLHEVDPAKPFFVKFTPGGTHAPHHPTPEWIEKIHGMHLFDKGWNALREQIFANQKKLGVIPADAQMTPWPDDLLKKWDQLNLFERRLFIRQVEVYAAYLAYTDEQIGRVIQAVESMGELENTLIIYISGDNGSSPEGSPNGTPNEVAQFNHFEVPLALQLERYYHDWGSDKTYNHMAVGWTWAFNTPYPWTKQIASHLGGTRQGMCVSWPAVIKDAGGIRNQFHHVIDIVPTILEACQIGAPETVDGIPQKPIEGTSLLYTFDKANEKTPTRHTTQYFEILGNRAIYHEGWWANTTPINPPWNLGATPNPDVANSYEWELYDLNADWTQSKNLAKAEPERLKALQARFMEEANKYQVLPLDNSLAARLVTPRPSVAEGRSEFTYSGELTGIPLGSAPHLIASSYTITAEVEIKKEDASGMLATQGGRFAGWGFYLLKGKPVFTWNLLDLQRHRWEGRALSPGKHKLVYDFKYDGLGLGTLRFNNSSGLGQGGTGVLSVDGKQVATHTLKHTVPVVLQWDETFDIGADTGTPVDDKDYQVPFKFDGRLQKLTIKVDPPKLTPADEKRLAEEASRK